MRARAKHVYQFGAFRLDATDRLLYRDGDLIPLPPKVFETLLLLVAGSGRLLGKDEMIKQLWPDTFVEEGTLAQYIFLLRKALGNSASWIENHSRRGYRFTGPVEEFRDDLAELRIEEHTPSRTVIEEEVIAKPERSGRFRIIAKDPEFSREDAKRLLAQVSAKDYNPPHRNRMLAWMEQQDFPICPAPEDPQQCNVYRGLKFPNSVYEKISEFYEQKEAQ